MRAEFVFAIPKEDLQDEARERIGRTLTEEEISTAAEGIEAGLTFDIETIFAAAIEMAVKRHS